MSTPTAPAPPPKRSNPNPFGTPDPKKSAQQEKLDTQCVTITFKLRPKGDHVMEFPASRAQRRSSRPNAGIAKMRLGLNDGWGDRQDGAWKSMHYDSDPSDSDVG